MSISQPHFGPNYNIRTGFLLPDFIPARLHFCHLIQLLLARLHAPCILHSYLLILLDSTHACHTPLMLPRPSARLDPSCQTPLLSVRHHSPYQTIRILPNTTPPARHHFTCQTLVFLVL